MTVMYLAKEEEREEKKQDQLVLAEGTNQSYWREEMSGYTIYLSDELIVKSFELCR